MKFLEILCDLMNNSYSSMKIVFQKKTIYTYELLKNGIVLLETGHFGQDNVQLSFDQQSSTAICACSHNRPVL